MNNIITFDKSAAPFVLEAFGKEVNEAGLVAEKVTGREVIARDGTKVPAKRFAGVKKGSEVYIKSDLISLIELCDELGSRKWFYVFLG